MAKLRGVCRYYTRTERITEPRLVLAIVGLICSRPFTLSLSGLRVLTSSHSVEGYPGVSQTGGASFLLRQRSSPGS